jgi:hypothetical protein
MALVMRRRMRAAAAAVIVLTSQLAHATPPGLTPTTPPGLTPEQAPAPAPTPAEPGLESYRGQVLAADGIAVGLMLVAIDKESDGNDGEAFAKLSLGTYLFGAPLVHLTKNRAGRALASAAMRIGFPILGGMLGDSMKPKQVCYDYCNEGPSDELVLGVLAGVVAASAVDAIYLAKGDPPKPAAQPAWTPDARPTQGGFLLGVRAPF